MIEVEVSVPALNQIYDFSVEEESRISLMIQDILSLLSQVWKIPGEDAGNASEYLLVSVDREEALDQEHCLADYGIANGARLILI